MNPTTSAPSSPSWVRSASSGGGGSPNRPRSTPLGETRIFSPGTPRNQIGSQPLADHRHRVGAVDRPGFERSGGAIAQRSLAAGAVADRRILPKGADLV